MTGLKPLAVLADSIEQRSQRTPTGCRVWSGARSKNGYGQIWTGEKVEYVHRIAYVAAHGPIPDGGGVATKLAVSVLGRQSSLPRPCELFERGGRIASQWQCSRSNTASPRRPCERSCNTSRGGMYEWIAFVRDG